MKVRCVCTTDPVSRLFIPENLYIHLPPCVSCGEFSSTQESQMYKHPREKLHLLMAIDYNLHKFVNR